MRAGWCAQDLLRRGLRAIDLRVCLLVKADLPACAPEKVCGPSAPDSLEDVRPYLNQAIMHRSVFYWQHGLARKTHEGT